MSRPIKEGLDYFPLDVVFDEKIQALESVFKNNGLVWIIKFWQTAYRSNNGEVSFNDYHGVIHRDNSRVTLEEHKKILKLCLEIGLVTKTNSGKYTSNGIKKRLEYVMGERKRWRIKHKIGVLSPIIPLENPEETGESKVKERKVKKSKVYIIPPVIEDVISYCQERKNNVNAEAWYNHYMAKGWFIGKTKMVDWKAAVRTWEDKNVKSKEPYEGV